jgi:hypothetical protein
MPRKAAPPPADGENTAPRRSSRISAIAKTVEAPAKKTAKPRKKRAAAAAENDEEKKEESVTEEEQADAKDANPEASVEPVAAEVNGSKRKASEIPEGKPPSKRASGSCYLHRRRS